MGLCETIKSLETTDTSGFYTNSQDLLTCLCGGYLWERLKGRPEKASVGSAGMERGSDLPCGKSKNCVGPTYLEKKSLKPLREVKQILLSLGRRWRFIAAAERVKARKQSLLYCVVVVGSFPGPQPLELFYCWGRSRNLISTPGLLKIKGRTWLPLGRRDKTTGEVTSNKPRDAGPA